ncbi:Calcium-transporting ATPase 4, endoplasmic reticulum-type [Hordeum vulgare]|nr:Calcium-transporting ATPase 4, endoplasmic reticulum-type [Hordeum vulgare]
MVFAGTTVVNGSAVCLVVHTGMATEIGKIHSQIHKALQEDDDTPLKKKLNEFGEALTMIIGLICILVWLIKGFVDEESDGEVKPFPAGRSGFSGGKERAPVSPASVWVLLFALLL